MTFHHSTIFGLDRVAPGAIALALQSWASGPGASPGVADQVDLHRVADAQHAPVDDRFARPAPGLLWAGTPNRGSSSRPSAAYRNPSSCPSSAWCRAAQSSRCRRASRPAATALPRSALATPAPSSSANSITSSVAPIAPAPTRIATLLPALSTSAAWRSSLVFWHDARRGVADARMHRPVTPFGGRRRRLLQVVGQNHARDGALIQRDADGAIDQVAGLLRHRGLLTYSLRDVLEQGRQVDFLLVTAAQRRSAPAARRWRAPAGDPSWRRRARSADGSRPGPTWPCRRQSRR